VMHFSITCVAVQEKSPPFVPGIHPGHTNRAPRKMGHPASRIVSTDFKGVEVAGFSSRDDKKRR
jgi:hypothetical protein